MTFDVEYNDLFLASASIENGTGIAYSNGNIVLGLENGFQLGSFEFEINFTPSCVDIINIIPTNRTTFDSFSINGNYISLINPIITSGDGPILILELFNNIGIEAEVLVSYQMCLGYTVDGNEVGISILDDAFYHIEAPSQSYNITNGNGLVGGGASIIVELENTVPITMALLKITNEPQVLIPSDEPYEDANGNGIYDEGENFTDWNGNSMWSPVIEPISLPDGWDLFEDIYQGEIEVGISNWAEPLEPNSRQLFQINYQVSDEASVDDIISLNSESTLMIDAWQNEVLSSFHSPGIVTIDGVLSDTKLLNNTPSRFSIDRVYPNPFNPTTKISFSVPLNGGTIKIKIFNVLGILQSELFSGTLEAGKHKIDWNASDKSSGIYFIELNTDQFREIKKVTLIK